MRIGLLLLACLSTASRRPGLRTNGPYYRPSVVVQLSVSDFGKAITGTNRCLGSRP